MLKGIIQSFVSICFLGVLLFLPAGTFVWPGAWIFLFIFAACSQAMSIWLMRTNPDLLAERMKSPISPDQRPSDRFIMLAIGLFFCVWLVFIALDARRFGWSHSPPWAQAVGAALIAGAFYGWVLVLRANNFASVTIRLQPERGQSVICSGPYAIVRHPMYAYALLLMLGMPLLLGSLWGLLGAPIGVLLLAARTVGEEALLMHGLAGYQEYAARVRFRLAPGVW